MKRLTFLLLAFTLALPLAGFADDAATPSGGDKCADTERTPKDNTDKKPTEESSDTGVVEND